MRLKDALGRILGQPAAKCKPCQVFQFLDNELARVCLGYQPQKPKFLGTILIWKAAKALRRLAVGTPELFLLLAVILGAQEVPLVLLTSMGHLERLKTSSQAPPPPGNLAQPQGPNKLRKKTRPLTTSQFSDEEFSTATDSVRSNNSSHTPAGALSISISKGMQEDVETQECVEVQVGAEESLKIFIINKTLLCGASDYCRRRFAPESRYKDEPIILNDFEPLIFEIFLQWISNPVPRIGYDPDGLPQEPWLSNAATTWLLGKRLQCSDDFDRYALSQFIQNCAFMAFGPWELIEKEATKGSLPRFSDHWVAWNYRLAGPGINEYSGLRAARTALIVPVRDPRTFDIEHWYSECGKYMRPGCLHDPITRLEKNEDAKRPKPIPPLEWGRSAELRREVCLTADSVDI